MARNLFLNIIVVFAVLTASGCDALRGLIQVNGDIKVASDNKAEVNINAEGLDKLAEAVAGKVQPATASSATAADIAKEVAKVIPTPAPTIEPTPVPIPASWKELTGTFRFTGLVEGQPAQILGGAFDYVNKRPVFWAKTTDASGSVSESAFALVNASPSLALARFEAVPEIVGPFDQKKFFEKLNGKPSIVLSVDQGSGLITFRSEYSPNLASVIVPDWWFGESGHHTEEDVSGALVIGKVWIIMVLPNFNPAQIWHVATPNEQYKYTDDPKSFGSAITYGFYSPSDGHDFFFTKRIDCYAEDEATITPN
ncbi:MAG: hypothetical protein Q7S47_01740 [bacterium]|nr:hypothetical protein [bacterium]